MPVIVTIAGAVKILFYYINTNENTRNTFMQKLHIFTHENNIIITVVMVTQ